MAEQQQKKWADNILKWVPKYGREINARDSLNDE